MPALSVAENLTLDDPPVRARARRAADRSRGDARAGAAGAGAARLRARSRPRVDRLSFAERQLVAIAKALRKRCRLLILDEPTAALETREIDAAVRRARADEEQGTAIIYVSHRLDEVVALADRCTVLRDGRVAAVSRRGAFAVGDLVQAMTGRADGDITADDGRARRGRCSKMPRAAGRIRCAPARSWDLPACSAAAPAACCGGCSDSTPSGAAIRVDGSPPPRQPADAIRAGIGMVPGERRLGLVMNLSVRDNILLPSLDALSRAGYARSRAPATAWSPS